MKHPAVSIILPVYNEQKLLKDNTLKLYKYLQTLPLENFEILLCDNGSTDETAHIGLSLQKLHPKIRLIHTDERGYGIGIRSGIQNATHDHLILFSIDLAFNLDFVIDALTVMKNENANIVVGSKGHPQSKIHRPLARKIASLGFNSMINTLFWMGISDTQGALAFKKSEVMKYLDKLTSTDTFFQTEYMITSHHEGLTIKEIPVTVEDMRASSFNLKKDIFLLFRKLLQLRWRLNRK